MVVDLGMRMMVVIDLVKDYVGLEAGKGSGNGEG